MLIGQRTIINNNGDISRYGHPPYKLDFDKIYKNDGYKKIKDNIIIETLRGSLLHGTYDDKKHVDDIDLIGIYTHNIDEYLKINTIKESVDLFIDEYDLIYYDIKKAIHMIAKANPNIFFIPWVPSSYIVNISKCGQMLLDNKDIFSSKLVYQTYSGYAKSEIERLSTINKRSGQKRRDIINKFGYDVKSASHAIRLITMCYEFISSKKLHVDRRYNDDQELLKIKLGFYNKEYVLKKYESITKKCKDAYEKSDLPEKPNPDLVNELLVNMINTFNKKELLTKEDLIFL